MSDFKDCETNLYGDLALGVVLLLLPNGEGTLLNNNCLDFLVGVLNGDIFVEDGGAGDGGDLFSVCDEDRSSIGSC